ncbi:MAG: ATP-binding protein [Sarcina sp.]
MLESNFFWSALLLGSTIMEWFVYDFMLKEISVQKRIKKVKYMYLAFLITYISLYTLLGFNVDFKLFSGIIFSVIYYFYIYDVKVIKGIIVPLIFWMLLLAGDIISTSLVAMFNNISNIDNLLSNDTSVRVQMILISKLLLISVVPIIKGAKLKKFLTIKEVLWVSIPMIANIFSMILIAGYAFEGGKVNAQGYFTIFLLGVLLLFSNISLVFIISNFIKSTKIKLENKVIKNNLEAQMNYYIKHKEVEDKIRKMYHDINNHVGCLDSIYGDNKEAKKYINAIKSEIKDYDTHFKTQNHILDAILYEKNSICKKENIDFVVNINFSKCYFIESIDVCTIFANILDNAIEACQKIDSKSKRYIHIKGTIVNGFYIVKCENSKANNVLFEGKKIITTKIDKVQHGIGLTNIADGLKKYDGQVTTKYDEKNFIVNILIPIKTNFDQLYP